MGGVGLLGYFLTRKKPGTYKNLEKYLSLSDVTKSYTATQQNILEQFNPPKEIYENADFVAKIFLNPLIKQYGVFDGKNGIQTDSWYRVAKLNEAVGGVDGSYHMLGFAVDVDLIQNGHVQNDLILDFIVDNNIPFTELALEYGSISNPNTIHFAVIPNRYDREVIRISNNANYVKPYSWLVDRFGS